MNTCQTGPTTQTFGWDGLRRLTDIDAGSVHDLAYGYDDFNRRTFKQYEHLLPTIQGDVYDYDGGSRLSDVWYDDANPTAGAPGTSLAHLEIQQTKVQARTSTTFNMVTTLYSTGDPLHRTTSIGGVPRTYDDKGNLTDNGAGRKFEYDAWNRMTRVLDGTGTELVRYEFDALGRRYQRIEGGTTTTRYVYDGPRLLEEYVDPGTGTFTLATRYIYGGGLDELIAIETGGQRYYTYRDALGSIEAITDSAGVVVERYDYDAFGVPTVTDGLGVPTPLGIYGEPTSQYGNDLWFTGARWDPESGNYHMRARQYEPLAGRFVSRDPLGYVDGPNAYSYGYSSPTNWTDPFGLEAKKGTNPQAGIGRGWPVDIDRSQLKDNSNAAFWPGIGVKVARFAQGAGYPAVAAVDIARGGIALYNPNFAPTSGYWEGTYNATDIHEAGNKPWIIVGSEMAGVGGRAVLAVTLPIIGIPLWLIESGVTVATGNERERYQTLGSLAGAAAIGAKAHSEGSPIPFRRSKGPELGLVGCEVKLGGNFVELKGVLRIGALDPEANILYLGKGGHADGMANAGGSPRSSSRGITTLETPDTVFWANDSMSLPTALTAGQASAVQAGLESAFSGKNVIQLSHIGEAP